MSGRDPQVVWRRSGVRSVRGSLARLTVAAVVMTAGGLGLGGGSGLALPGAAGTSWAIGVGAVLPANAVTAGNQFVQLKAVSCASAGNCSAVGSYRTVDSPQGLLLAETAGTWATGVEAVLPANAATTNQTVDLGPVSCALPGYCGAVGTYVDDNGNTEGLLLTETAGTWANGVEAALPANALSVGQAVQLSSVSCASAANCTAVGTYLVGGTESNHGLILTESAGTWSAGVEPPLPVNASSGQGASVASVSCVSAGECTAVGDYVDASGIQQGLLLSKTAGNWATGAELTVPADAYSLNPEPSLASVSCASAGNCSAVGSYNAGPAGVQGLLVTETGGSWTAGVAAVLPANASSSPGPLYSLGSVSCPSTGNCSAAGMYDEGNSAMTQGLLLGESGGVWSPGIEAALPANAAPGYPADVTSVSCPSAGNCVAVGRYFDDDANRGQGLLLTETAGAWATGVEAAVPSDPNIADPNVTLAAVACASVGNCSAVGTYENELGVDGLLIDSPAPTVTLDLAKNGTGSGTVSSVPAGIDCGTTCSHGYLQGTSVALTATPAAGSTFTGWTGACTGTATCNVSMDADTSVGATFTLIPPRPQKCVVPRVTGKTLTAAKRSIKSRSCSVGKVKHSSSRTTKKGHVISQKPKPGTRLAHGAKVNLVVSKGR